MTIAKQIQNLSFPDDLKGTFTESLRKISSGNFSPKLFRGKSFQKQSETKSSVIGLDIGSTSIKAVLLKNDNNRLVVEQTFRKEIIPSEGNPLHKALEELFEEELFADKDIVAALSSRSVSFRTVTLPFAQHEKIKSTLTYELDGRFPFDVETKVVSYYPLQLKEGDSKLIAVVADRKNVGDFLADLNDCSINPESLWVDIFGLSEAMREQVGPASGTVGIIDIGATKTSLVFLEDGELQEIYSLNFGGNEITEAVSKKQELSIEEAEEWKRENPEESLAMAEEAIQRFLRDCKRVLMAFKKERASLPETFVYCGGSMKSEPFVALLSNKLNQQFIEWMPFQEKVVFPEAETGNKSDYLIAFGLAASAIRGNQESLNLRKHEFRFRGGERDNSLTIARGSVIACVLTLLIGIGLFSYNMILKSKRNSLQEQTNAIFHELVPGKKRIVNPVVQLRGEQKTLTEKHARLIDFSGEQGTALKVLRHLTESMNGLNMEVLNYSYNVRTIFVDGKTNSFETVDKIKGILLNSKQYEMVNISNAQLDQDKSSVKFRITISLKNGTAL